MHPEPDLKNPVMFCGWPGIGNIGIIAIDTLRNLLRAAEFAEIEPWDFFNPRKVVIEEGLLQELRFPENKFYYQRLDKLDLIFFIGQEQTFERRTAYAEGEKAYQLANLVLDVAEKFNCSRIYTSGAAVAPSRGRPASPGPRRRRPDPPHPQTPRLGRTQSRRPARRNQKLPQHHPYVPSRRPLRSGLHLRT